MKPIQKLFVTTLLLIILGISFNQSTNTSALPADSMTQEAARTLQNHDKGTGLNSTELINMLDLVNESQSMRVTCGNITLSVSKSGPTHFELSNGIRCDDDTVFTYFEWVYVYNGVEFNRVKVTFSNGTLSRFDDDRATHPIGSIDINVPKEQAIDTAKNYVAGFINKYNLTIANVTAVLDSTWNETGALHPFWGVKILFNQNTSGVHVYVWADSGLVHWSYRDNGSPFNVADYPPITTEEPFQPDPTEMPSISTSNGDITANTEQTNEQPNNETMVPQGYSWTQIVIPIIIITIIAVTVIALLLFIKRKSKAVYPFNARYSKGNC